MNFRNQQPSLSLDGEWQLAFSDTIPAGIVDIASLEASGLPLYTATVPGNFELDLQANGLIGDPFFGMNPAGLTWFERSHIWYARRFAASPPPDRDALLVFEGLDCFAEIYLNGERIGATDNMLVEHAFPVSLRAENELLVHIRPAVAEAQRFSYPPLLFAERDRNESLYVRKAPHMYGWDIMPRIVSAGIWRPVTVQFLPRERLESVYLETQSIAPDRSEARLLLHFEAKTAPWPPEVGQYEVEVEGRCGDSVFTKRERMLFPVGRTFITARQPQLWWPKGRGAAPLYDVRVRLLRDGVEVDALTFTHGIRMVALDRTSVTDENGSGEFRFRINGEQVFILGSNWVPVDAFHSRDAERIPAILEMADDLGCNMLRCWGGNVYENDLFYDICDRKGILIWQDFAMACAIYPQDAEFQRRLASEVRHVVKRLRQHACIVLWAGDNECDQSYGWGGRQRDPNANVLTRVVIPNVLREEDETRPYLPSSPYMDSAAYASGERYLPENHLWGPRDYYKSEFYVGALCHFASEIGYHGCPSPESLRKFLSPDRLWPYQDNPEWLLHSTSPVPGVNLYDYRVELMAKQVRALFGEVPDNLDDFTFASQASQAEAKKFFVEMFRAAKWRRTGILWWNLMDGWPQLSDAIVDYYFGRKLAYGFLKRSQSPLCLVLREPEGGAQEIVACNDLREDVTVSFSVEDAETGETVVEGEAIAAADAVTALGRIPFAEGAQRLYALRWRTAAGAGVNHYLAGRPPFPLADYRRWLKNAGVLFAT
jgi:beta-mannosidase